MTIVLDCNILVMCLTSRSPYHKIYQSLIAGKFSLAVTTDILLEYEEVIQQKYSPDTAGAFMALLNVLPNVQQITTYYRFKMIAADPDDDKYCDCAVASQAEFIVTEDNHFDVLQHLSFPRLRTLSIIDFSQML